MSVECRQAAGIASCPDGKYALYEHPGFNAAQGRGQTVISDESVSSLNGYHSHADLTSSVVNKTSKVLELFRHADYRGESMTVEPGQSVNQLPMPFDYGISSSRLNSKGTGMTNPITGAAKGAVMGATGQLEGQAKGKPMALESKVFSSSEVGPGQDATITLPEGYVLTGGGMQVNFMHR
ncbi:peptidase inhibitor family I36 protein [Streptomyces sp. SYSU K21746]